LLRRSGDRNQSQRFFDFVLRDRENAQLRLGLGNALTAHCRKWDAARGDLAEGKMPLRGLESGD